MSTVFISTFLLIFFEGNFGLQMAEIPVLMQIRPTDRFTDDSNAIRGGAALAEAIKQNRVLTELYLGSSQVGNDGAIAFAEALKTNTVLEVLDLYHNQIDSTGATALASALKGESTGGTSPPASRKTVREPLDSHRFH